MRSSPWKWLVGVAVLVLPGCGDAEVPPPQARLATYVGAIAETNADAVVAFVVGADRAMFYVCGGASTVETHTHWLDGTVHEGVLQLANAGWTATGGIAGDLATGSVVRDDGESFQWSAHEVGSETIAGLYATVDSGCRTGVVVTQDSAAAEPWMQGSWCNESGTRMQVTPILPIELTTSGIEVQVLLDSGARRLEVQPVRY